MLETPRGLKCNKKAEKSNNKVTISILSVSHTLKVKIINTYINKFITKNKIHETKKK
jgi:hypothetical protein